MKRLVVILVLFLAFAAIITFYLSFKYSEAYTTSSEETILPPAPLEPTVLPSSLPEPTVGLISTPSNVSINSTNQTSNETVANFSTNPKVIAKNYHYYVKDSPVSFPPLFDVTYTPPYLKLELGERLIFQKKYYDTIYIDRTKDIAVGFCESKDCMGDTTKGVLLNYYTSEIVTPDEWLDRFKGAEKKDSVLLIMGREVYYVHKQPYEGWIDVYYGLPLRVKEGTVAPLYFEYLEINDPALNATPKYGFTYDDY